MIDLSIFKDADLTNLKSDLDTLDNELIGTTYDYECRLTESCSPRELLLNQPHLLTAYLRNHILHTQDGIN